MLLGAAAAALVFALLGEWTGFILCAVATLLALVQLVRIRARRGTGGGRRW